MIDLIVFNVGGSKYALNIENIQRIIHSVELTNIPNANSFIDGMMSYEDNIIKVLNFRKVIGLLAYDEELKVLFENLKNSHKEWIAELENSLENSTEFTKTTDSHKCKLGMWIDNFNSYDNQVSNIVKELDTNHKNLHILGSDVLSINKYDKALAMRRFKEDVSNTFKKTINSIDNLIGELDLVANSFQKLLIYERVGKTFAIKVDSIEDIAHIEESNLIYSDDEEYNNEFLELDGVLKQDGILINVIKRVDLAK